MNPFIKYCYETSAVGVWWEKVLGHQHDCKIDWHHFDTNKPEIWIKKKKKDPKQEKWELMEGLFERLTIERFFCEKFVETNTKLCKCCKQKIW